MSQPGTSGPVLEESDESDVLSTEGSPDVPDVELPVAPVDVAVVDPVSSELPYS